MLADQRAWTETAVRDMISRPATILDEDLMRFATVAQAISEGRAPGGMLAPVPETKKEASGE
eukprot:1537139-Pyramimonas_sp.AAC.1